MAKTQEELNEIKKEVETLNKKLAELTEEELKQVTGGEVSIPTKWYKIQEGDTLRKIADQFGTTIAVLFVLNPEIVNPYLIEPGEWILVPENPTEK